MRLFQMNFEACLNNMLDDDMDSTPDKDHGGVVIPKQTCEHVGTVPLIEEINLLANNQCIDCECPTENWLCLSCGEAHCSRYVNNHGEEHWLFTLLTDEHENTGHCLTMSLQDLSVWCYPCKSYIMSARLKPLIKRLESIKFDSSSTSREDSLSSQPILDQIVLQTTITPTEAPRLSTIIAIQDLSLLEEFKTTDLLSYCQTMKLRAASIDELVGLHSSDYVNTIVSAERNASKATDNRFHLDYTETSFGQARVSAGTTMDVIENVLKTDMNGFVLVTSPGHRAFHDHGNGTSIYNNIALAVNNVLLQGKSSEHRKSSLALIDSNNHIHREGATPIEDAICHMIHVLSPASTGTPRLCSPPTKDVEKDDDKPRVERVLIVDLTCEHGCGLQSLYYESKQVAYVSIHRETHQHRSSFHECGKNAGLGYTINLPLASLDTASNQDYVQIMNELILPLAEEFQPELIVVAVDFQVPQLTDECYGRLIEQLSNVNNSKLVVVLDGDPSSIASKSSYVRTVLNVLLGQVSTSNDDQWRVSEQIQSDVRQKVDLLKEKHRRYWSCFQ